MKMNDYDDAIEQEGNIKIVVCQEKGRKYVLNNISEKYIRKIHVDGNLIKTGVRCDYAVDISDGDSVYLIELKGSDKEHAFEQLLVTLDFFHKKYTTKKYFCRALLSRTKSPNLMGKNEKLLMKAVKEKRCENVNSASILFDKDRI